MLSSCAVCKAGNRSHYPRLSLHYSSLSPGFAGLGSVVPPLGAGTPRLAGSHQREQRATAELQTDAIDVAAATPEIDNSLIACFPISVIDEDPAAGVVMH